MFRVTLIVMLACTHIEDPQCGQRTANDKDRESLQGKWRVVSMVHAGKKEKLKDLDLTLFVEGDKLTFIEEGPSPFVIDASKSPKTIDIKNKGFSDTGIYEIKNDELRLCLHGKKRPKDFESTRENGNVFVVLKRLKK